MEVRLDVEGEESMERKGSKGDWTDEEVKRRHGKRRKEK